MGQQEERTWFPSLSKNAHRITLDIDRPHWIFRWGRWLYWTSTVFMAVLFILKMSGMFLNAYSDGARLHAETVDAIRICESVDVDSSRIMRDFCEKVKRGERLPFNHAVGETADRIYWGFMVTLQAMLSSVYTLVVVAVVSVAFGYYISSRGLFLRVTPKWFVGRPCDHNNMSSLYDYNETDKNTVAMMERMTNAVNLLKEE